MPEVTTPLPRAPKPRLPGPVRAARIAEGLYLPVAVYLFLGVALTDTGTLALAALQIGAAVAVVVGLGRMRKWAWALAMVLALYILGSIAMRAPDVVRSALETGHAGFYVALVLVAYVALAQVVVLVGCAMFAKRWGELR
ncbi:MAG TPA: hypothetical protein VHG91_13020 [Longimicrobium sp.]|nr:hypothetical protein [Longimicrobium sp.]